MARQIFSKLFDGICAALMIVIGCAVYLACEPKWVGAILFAVALLTICYQGYNLYTGKIGFIIDDCAGHRSKQAFSTLLLGLLGNVIAASVFGIALQYALPSLQHTSYAICQAKLEMELWQALIRAIFCGVLMYVAVAVFKNHNKNPLGIIFCIPTFILCGFEHSIADMGYFAIAGIYSAKAFAFILIVIIGNSIGSLLLPALQLASGKITQKNPDNTDLKG